MSENEKRVLDMIYNMIPKELTAQRIARWVALSSSPIALANEYFFGDDNPLYDKIRSDLYAMLVVTSGQYAYTTLVFESNLDNEDAQGAMNWRHLDQLISGSLQLRTYWRFASIHGWNSSFNEILIPFLASIAAIYLADNGVINWKLGYAITVASMALVLYQIWKINEYLESIEIDSGFVSKMFLLWIVYILAILSPDFQMRDIVISLLDTVQRAGYTIAMSSLLKAYPYPSEELKHVV